MVSGWFVSVAAWDERTKSALSVFGPFSSEEVASDWAEAHIKGNFTYKVFYNEAGSQIDRLLNWNASRLSR